MLERANTQKSKVDFKKLFFLYLWVYLCLEVGENGLAVSTRGLTPCRVLCPAQCGSLLAKISDKDVSNRKL